MRCREVGEKGVCLAVTQGQGSPDWTQEETILALDLYLSGGQKTIGKDNARVLDLSSLLQRMPWPEGTTKNEKFRNNEGVSMKILNLRSVFLGHGLRSTVMDRLVIGNYGSKPEEVARFAAQIRDEIAKEPVELAAEMEPTTDDTLYPEERLLTAIHKRRERNPKLRSKLIHERTKRATLQCEMCRWGKDFRLSEYIVAALEVQHVVPLSVRDAEETRLFDLALLCANCHRLIHRAIVVNKAWLGVEECRRLLYGS